MEPTSDWNPLKELHASPAEHYRSDTRGNYRLARSGPEDEEALAERQRPCAPRRPEPCAHIPKTIAAHAGLVRGRHAAAGRARGVPVAPRGGAGGARVGRGCGPR